jgi:hypothetical protein
MKKNLVVLFVIVTFISCTKNTDSATSANVGLNAIENNLKGKWFLKSKSDSTYLNGTLSMATTATYTLFQGTPYVEMYTTKSQVSMLGGANAKDAKDAGSNLASLELGPPLAITGNGFWYYDETAKMLNWGGVNLNLVKATGTDLELKFSSGNYSQVGYNLTWKFQR